MSARRRRASVDLRPSSAVGRRGRAAFASALGLAVSLALALPRPSVAGEGPLELQLTADLDDDDANGVRDGLDTAVRGAARRDLVALPLGGLGGLVFGKRAALSSDGARIVWRGAPLALPAVVPTGAELQGVRPGGVTLTLGAGPATREIRLRVVAHGFEDAEGRELDPSVTHLSFSRALPEASPADDPDGFRVVTRGEGPGGGTVDVLSLSARGAVLDAVRGVPVDAPCAGGVAGCARSRPLRVVIDRVDRQHPSSAGRSLLGEVGGLVVVARGGQKRSSIHVGGPRASGRPGAPAVAGRYRLHVRATVFRAEKTGKPGIFRNEAEAISEARADLEDAATLWAQCGISLHGEAPPDVRIAAPPPPYLVSFGTDLGLPSTGGVLRVRVEGRPAVLVVPPGKTPDEVARLFALEVQRAGFRAVVSRNARITPGAAGSADVLISRAEGRGAAALARVEADGMLCTDSTLSVAIGAVDLSDGLTHFGDMDSPAGSLEERSLAKALDDADPRVVQLVYVPYFLGGGRVGESFIYGDGSSVKNVILVDRSGVRTRRSSHVVAHELGHVLLDVPGHPDDFGRDTPSLLMDSDASDASVYGPRRLTDDECARVRAEAGPRAKVPLLEAWPFAVVPLPSLAP
ncbi:MAG: hypothetical protein IPQ09_20900 [Myxococcales bacterium]|nr:hypothetical protein [Myxococcales bacterium]HQY62481.1 hypothetical protein [Polyangiaceae bacterium]